MGLRQKAIKGVVWSALESWGRQVISFGVFSLLARLLGPEAFGLVAMATVFLAFIQVFVDQGLSTALVQRQEVEPEHLDTAFWANIGISSALTGLSIASAGFVANFYDEPELTPVLCWLSFSFVLTGLSGVQIAILQRKLAFKALATRSLVAIIVSAVVGVAMAFAGFGVWSLVGQRLSNSIAQVACLWWVSDWRPGFRISKRHFKELFTYGINISGINFLNYINRYSDNLLIGYFLDSVALGYYTVAYRILTVVTELMVSVIQKIAMPIFSLLKQEPEKLRKAFYSAIQLTSLIAFPVFIGISVLSPELITTLLGEQWRPSIPALQFLSLIGPLYAGFYYNGSVMMALGKPSWHLGINFIQAIGNVTFFLIAVRWGFVAVAASYVIRGYLMSPLPVIALKKLLNIDLATYLRQYLVPLIGSIAMVVSILVARYFLNGFTNVYVLLAIYVLVGAVAYLGTILLIAPTLFRQAFALLRSVKAQATRKKT